MIENINKNSKRQLKGIITSDKMSKTRVVLVTRMKRHHKYEKYYKVSTKFKAHDENNEFHIGDEVTIFETRPLSRDKRFIIVGKTNEIKKEI